MRLLPVVSLVVWLSVTALNGEGAAGPPEALARKVSALLAAAKPDYPDPWRPRYTRPRRVVVIPGEKLSYGERLTAMALAGLANRDGPRLFIRGHFGFNADADRFWLQRLADDYGIRHSEISLDDALGQFRSSVRGCVVCDDKLPASEAVGLSLAGQLRLLPALPSMLPRLEAARIPVALDLRGAWADHVAAQAWALDTLGRVLSDRLIGFLGVRGKALWGIADYLVMHGAFVADLSSDQGKHPHEYALRDRALARLRPGSIVWGWVCHDSESQHVAHASRRGMRVLCSTNCPNLSLLSQIRPKTRRYRQKSPKPQPRAVHKKLYLTFVLTDGDSIPILLTRQWYRWDDPARGKVPFGWEHQPLLADLAPVVFEYYYETMTPNDRLIAGPSGAGYIHPAEVPDLGDFIRQTRECLRRTDLHCVGVCAPWDEKAAQALARGIPEAVGFLHGWSGDPSRPLIMPHGKPYLHYWLCPARPEDSRSKKKDAAYFAAEADKIRRIVARQGLPCFVAAHLSCYWSTPSDVPKLVQALGDVPHEILLPDQFLLMVGHHYGDRVLLEPLDAVPLMPGAATRLTLKLTSTRSRPTLCDVRIVAPDGVAVAQETTAAPLDAFGRAAIAATLRAAKPVEGQHLAVKLAWAGERAEHRIPLRPVAPIEDAREGLVLHSVWEAEKLSHNTGAEASDADAHNGEAWRAVPGKHKAGTHAVWGPYEDLPPGRYTAVFRLKAARRAEAPVARLDVYNHWLGKEGKQGVRAERTLKGTDFAAAGRYQDFALDFDRTATGKVEYRVHWPGSAALAIDRVVVLRIPPRQGKRF